MGRKVTFGPPVPTDFPALFGMPLTTEVLRIDDVPHAMAMLVRKPDGRVFAWTSFREDLADQRDAMVGALVVATMRRALRAYRRDNPSVPIYSGADDRGAPLVGKMLTALGFQPTDEFQRENMNRVWVWRP